MGQMHDACFYLSVWNVFVIFFPRGVGANVSLAKPNAVFLWKQRANNQMWGKLKYCGRSSGMEVESQSVRIENTDHWASLNDIFCSKGMQGTRECYPGVLALGCDKVREQKQTPSLVTNSPLLLWVASEGFMSRFLDFVALLVNKRWRGK